MIKKMLAVIVGASLVFSVGNLWAADTTTENTSLPNLMIKKEQETSCRRVYSVFSRSHYKEIDIKDVNFINKVIDRYIDGLDSTHTILTQAKVDEIYAAKDMFRRSLTECNLDFSLKLYEDLLKVKVQKYEYFISLLDKGFDFTLDDKIALDTSKLPFAKSEEELKNLWTLTVKKDFLNLKLAGKSDEKIKELLNDTAPDEQRILTEVAIFADKVAVAEETVRLRSHIKQFEDLLSDTKPVGRKLDFIVQEMNRETNTIGSKAQDIEIAHTVVDIKSEIEKIREQIQNME